MLNLLKPSRISLIRFLIVSNSFWFNVLVYVVPATLALAPGGVAAAVAAVAPVAAAVVAVAPVAPVAAAVVAAAVAAVVAVVVMFVIKGSSTLVDCPASYSLTP